jgi:hypothetical protein
VTITSLQPTPDRLKDAAYCRAHELGIHKGRPIAACPDCADEKRAFAGCRVSFGWAA